MGNQISLQNIYKSDRNTSKRVTTANMHGKQNGNSVRLCQSRSYSRSRFSRPFNFRQSARPANERKNFKTIANGISGTWEKILGTKNVGKGILCRNNGKRYNRNDKGIHQTSFRKQRRHLRPVSSGGAIRRRRRGLQPLVNLRTSVRSG